MPHGKENTASDKHQAATHRWDRALRGGKLGRLKKKFWLFVGDEIGDCDEWAWRKRCANTPDLSRRLQIRGKLESRSS